MNKNDFINTICEATEKLIAAAKLENPREMKPLFTDVPIGDNESVNICAEYEFTDDGDIDDLWIYFDYNRGRFGGWLRRPASDLNPVRIKKMIEEIYQMSKEECM